MSEFNICLRIGHDGDFYVEKLPQFQEMISDEQYIILDATRENVDLIAKQLEIAAVSVDTKEWMKDTLERYLIELFSTSAGLIRREIQYYDITGNWLDFSIEADFGNQTVSIGLVSSGSISYDDYFGTTWDGLIQIHYSCVASREYLEEIDMFCKLLDAIERGEAQGFDAASYNPNDMNSRENTVAVLDPVLEKLWQS